MAAGIDRLLWATRRAFNARVHCRVRVPDPCNVTATRTSGTIAVDGIVTDDDTSPRWDNFAFLVQVLRGGDTVEEWGKRLKILPADGALFASEGTDDYILATHDAQGNLVLKVIAPDHLDEALARFVEQRFTPRRLARLRRGQLTFADAASSISRGTLEFASRHLRQLGEALEVAILGAIDAMGIAKRRTAAGTAIMHVAIAYLAARILEDKGFFGEEHKALVNSPGELLRNTASLRNGFFQKAVHDALPQLEAWRGGAALIPLASSLGAVNTFALVDHHDVGSLYERILNLIPSVKVSAHWRDLQQHYTPIGITSRMLERLPLERIPPSERYVFDPTAGSGSLLLAASLRLAAMSDLPVQTTARRAYLAEHVVGNDIDELARDITNLRYCLVQETAGSEATLPAPQDYRGVRYQSFTRENLGFRPGVIVANPPFAQDKGVQRAAAFVNDALALLDKGAQFAFVLPQSFMQQNTDGVGESRRALTQACEIFEIWQLPEGVTGLVARQAVCIILGAVGRSRYRGSVARAIYSGSGIKEVRDSGFLGPAWIAQVPEGDWQSAIAPPVEIKVPTVPLESLFLVYTGAQSITGTEPKATVPITSPAVPYWRPKWRADDSLWANPARVFEGERWRLTRDLKRSLTHNAQRVVAPKVMAANSNRNAEEPHRPCFDDNGFWPDQNVHCISIRPPDHQRRSGAKSPKKIGPRPTPNGWWEMNERDRLLWLTGILGSDLGTDLWIAVRGTEHASKDAIYRIRLPAAIDPEIAKLVNLLIRDDMKPKLTSDQRAKTHAELDAAVMRSYGDPERVRVARVGVGPELATMRGEHSEPAFTVVGQVLDVDPIPGRNRVRIHLLGTLDEDPETWIPLPQEMPGWALDGTPFEVDLSASVETFETLRTRPWALRNFRHAPRPYRTLKDLRRGHDTAEQDEP